MQAITRLRQRQQQSVADSHGSRNRQELLSAGLSWLLLGVHTSRMHVDNRDVADDERLNLKCAWYADIIMKLTQPDRDG
jgi:hypothetical protein